MGRRASDTIDYRTECDECGRLWISVEPTDICGRCKEDEIGKRVYPKGIKDSYTAYYGVNWQEIRERVLERDNYTCQGESCDITNAEHKARDDLFPPNGGLHVHHRQKSKRFETYEAANDLDNLIALCADCHRAAEQDA